MLDKDINEALNNGGKTNYYDLPLPNSLIIYDYLEILFYQDTLNENNEIIYNTINLILELCPQTLNDLIEYKNMYPFQHEIFKACYALKERAKKGSITEGKLNIERELNKIIYYANRGLNLVKEGKI